MTPEEFAAALTARKSVIDLSDAPMGEIRLSRLKFPEPVTIRGGVFATLEITECENALGRALYRLDKAIEVLG